VVEGAVVGVACRGCEGAVVEAGGKVWWVSGANTYKWVELSFRLPRELRSEQVWFAGG